MIEQYLSNTNKIATVRIILTSHDLNKSLEKEYLDELWTEKKEGGNTWKVPALLVGRIRGFLRFFLF
jgi:hypothetical protein